MKLSLDWLNDYVDLSNIEPEEVARQLTMKSAEVEDFVKVFPHFNQVVTAKVVKVVEHPNSDHLHLATIFDGKGEQTVVCGAPNIAEGQIVAFAPLGTVLPGNFEIKPAKIRGVESCGMICAEDELGLSDDHAGIMVLPADTKIGVKLGEIFDRQDFVIEIENKTINHRPDLWGHYGIARELRAIFELPWKRELTYHGIKADKVDEKFEIEIKTPRCLHYLGLKVSNLKTAPSPEWMRKRLENVGLRPINNIVDISNYVMYEVGHPLHTFDRRDITGNKIVIRDAFEGEPFVTLDNVSRVLKSTDAVIADESRSLAIAGVMGGLNSEIKDDTTEIFIESALFAPASVRRTANRLDLRTDAVNRYEKSLWVENCYLAMERTVTLIKEIIPGAIVTSELATADNSEGYGFKGNIVITTDRIRSLLGIPAADLSDEKIVSMLTYLDFGIKNDAGKLTIEVPVHRRSKDVSIAEDIVEEVGRLYGFNNIKPENPNFGMIRPARNIDLEKSRKIRDLMVKGFSANEVMNYIFYGNDDLDTVPFPKEKLVETVADRDTPYLRYSLFQGLIRNVHENIKNFKQFTLFEFGRVFSADGEKKRLGIIAVGRRETFDFAKEIAVSIAKELATPQPRFERLKDNTLCGEEILHPNKSAAMLIGKDVVGIFGEVHPAVLKKCDIRTPVVYMEFEQELLFAQPEKGVKFTPLLKFPSTGFDVTAIIPEKTEVAQLLGIIKKAVDPKIFMETKVVDRFKGTPIPEGFISVTFRVVLNAHDRTLTSDEMKAVQQLVFGAVRKAGYKISGD
ncbi:phenylalanine--tRNA ligase subunit beta [bacterium]|nr:phenylalanine--tRNA ligase subunit beta [bacterium]